MTQSVPGSCTCRLPASLPGQVLAYSDINAHEVAIPGSGLVRDEGVEADPPSVPIARAPLEPEVVDGCRLRLDHSHGRQQRLLGNVSGLADCTFVSP